MDYQKNTIYGLFWIFAEKWGAQIINFIVSIILARLLLPDDYGKVALCSVFISILNNFINCGMGTALIQKKNADNIDFSSLFYFNIFLGFVIYLFIYSFAPFADSFFHVENMCVIVRVIGLYFIISSFKEIQYTYAFKNFLFKKFFFSTLGGTIFAAII